MFANSPVARAQCGAARRVANKATTSKQRCIDASFGAIPKYPFLLGVPRRGQIFRSVVTSIRLLALTETAATLIATRVSNDTERASDNASLARTKCNTKLNIRRCVILN